MLSRAIGSAAQPPTSLTDGDHADDFSAYKNSETVFVFVYFQMLRIWLRMAKD
jgi:hypothetical protein